MIYKLLKFCILCIIPLHIQSMCIYYTAAVSASCWMLQGLCVLPRLQEWHKRLELSCLPTNYTGRPQDTFGDKSKWFPVLQPLWFGLKCLSLSCVCKVSVCHTASWFLWECFEFGLLLNFSSLFIDSISGVGLFYILWPFPYYKVNST